MTQFKQKGGLGGVSTGTFSANHILCNQVWMGLLYHAVNVKHTVMVQGLFNCHLPQLYRGFIWIWLDLDTVQTINTTHAIM